jgi:hypothetical protein
MKAREWLIHIIARESDGSLEFDNGLRKKTAVHAEINMVESRIWLYSHS